MGGLPAPRCQPRLKGRNHDAFPRRLGAEVDLVLVDREVRHAAPEPEEGLARVAVPPVLQDGVVEGLLRETVLQLEGEDGEPVDEEPDVERALGIVPAVPELASDAELVLEEAPLGRRVLGGRRAIEEVEVVGAVLDPVAQDIDGAALADLALEAGEKLAACGAVFVEADSGSGVRLGGVEEGAELDQVDAVLAVVVVMVAGGPADAAVRGRTFPDGAAGRGIARVAGQGLADEPFEAAFGEVGRHGWISRREESA